MDRLLSNRRGTDLGRISVSDPGWTTPSRGVRLPGSVPITHANRVASETAVSARLAVACDLTAAHLWAMVLPSGFGLDVDAQACALATNRGGSRHRAAGIRGRRLELPASHLTMLDGVALTTPARTWLDCAAMIPWRDLVAMGDAMLRHNLAAVHDLEHMVSWGRGRRGVRSARQALGILDPQSESPGESWLRAYLISTGIPQPVCNFPVTIGEYAFRLDLAWPPSRVAAEYDGTDFHDDSRRHRDDWRRNLLRQAGWVIIVVRKEDLSGRDDIPSKINSALANADRQRARVFDG